jgi:hypothetical protein
MLALFNVLSLSAQLSYLLSAGLSVVSIAPYLDFPEEVNQYNSIDVGRYRFPSSRQFTSLGRLAALLLSFLSIILGWSDAGLETRVQEWMSPLYLVINQVIPEFTNVG